MNLLFRRMMKIPQLAWFINILLATLVLSLGSYLLLTVMGRTHRQAMSVTSNISVVGNLAAMTWAVFSIWRSMRAEKRGR